MSSNKPRIALIGTGGTISSIGKDPLDLIDYPDGSRKMEVDEVIEKFDLVKEFVEPVPIRFRAVGSTHIGPPDWLDRPARSPKPPVTIHRLPVSLSRTAPRPLKKQLTFSISRSRLISRWLLSALSDHRRGSARMLRLIWSMPRVRRRHLSHVAWACCSCSTMKSRPLAK